MTSPRTLTILTAAATLAAALAIHLPGVATVAHHQPGPPTRTEVTVMVVGDSITHQYPGNHTWRARLVSAAASQAVTVRLVGPITGVHNDPTHPGRAQASYAHLALNGATLATHQPTLAQHVTTYAPDLLAIFIGHNDLAQGTTPTALRDGIATYVNTARTARPGQQVLLAEVLPATRTGFANTTLAEQANTLLRQYAATTPGVTLVPTATGYNPTTSTYDGLHLNNHGEAHIARTFGATLHHLGHLPNDAPVPTLPTGN